MQCQALLALGDAERALFRELTKNDIELKSGLVSFIHNVFIDTPLVDRKLAERRDMFQLLGFANDEIDFLVAHFEAKDDYGENADLYFRAPNNNPGHPKRRDSSTNDNRHLDNLAYPMTNVEGVDELDLKAYLLALLHLVCSVLRVATSGEIRMKYGSKILSEVRRR